MSGGLISEIVNGDALMDRAVEIAQSFIGNTSAMSIAMNRQLLWRMMGADHPMQAHQIESRTMMHSSMRDRKEGVQSFLEKRAPEFEDKVSGGAPVGLDWDKEPNWA